jgi:DNA-binding transcriptional LysR family regulator
MIHIHRLEGFFWVARTGGYARAARAFPYPITQPAVHQQVKKLESDLGTALFERVGKDRIQLTPAGERLYRFVQPFFEGLPGLVRSLQEKDYGGELRIAAMSLVLKSLLPEWLRRLYRRNPDIRVHLREALAPEIELLRRGEVDLVVDYLPEVPDDLASLPVAVLRPFLVLPRSHHLARRAQLSLSDFAGQTFVAYSPSMLAHDLQMRALGQFGVVPPQVLTASSAEVILSFVEGGFGFSILPAFEPEGPRGRGVKVLPLLSPRVEFPVLAAWRKQAAENPLLDAFLETAPKE